MRTLNSSTVFLMYYKSILENCLSCSVDWVHSRF